MMPANWTIKKLEDIATKISDGIHSTPKYVPCSEHYFINGNNLKDNKIVIGEKTKCVSENEYLKHKKELNENTILLSINGTIGSLAFYKNEKVVLGKSAAYINLIDEVSKEFIFYVLSSSKVKAYFESELTGSTIRNLSLKSVKNTKIQTPPIPEQITIADLLSTWDTAIEKTEQLIAAKEEAKKGLMQQLLFGKIRLGSRKNGDSTKGKWFFTPGDWKKAKIGAVAKEVSEKNANRDDLPVLSCTKHQGLVDSLEYFDKQVFSKDTSPYKIVAQGQFAYATNHIEEGSIGYQNLYPKGLISPMYTVFAANSKMINNGYLYKLLKTETFRRIFAINTNASVDRRGSLRWKEFAKLPISLPGLPEQEEINQVLETAQQEITLLQRQLDLLKKQKRGLMQKLLTGQWRVKAPESQ